MAGLPPHPANTTLSSYPSPPSVSSQSSVAFTPSATSVADSSDNEFDPTPVHSPHGPQYEDLPPSYDDARHQAVHDARNGIAPIDPNQIEAHRITPGQGPNEPEIWEYRVRGEQLDPASEQEQAPDYANHRSDKATSIPVQHVSSTENIPVGRTGSEFYQPTPIDLASAMLNQALEFTRQQPNTPAQYAPRLNRIIAIPGQGGTDRPAGEHEQFLCAYTQTLHGHAIEPDQFLNFLRGLNVLLRSTNTTAADLRHESSSLVSQYIRGANEAFFAPRGLRVSFRNEAAILASLPLPAGPGQRDAVADRLLQESTSAATRAQRLTPWIEPLNTEKLPAPSEHMYTLHEIGERFSRQANSTAHAYEDPPHSIPTTAEEARYGAGQQHSAQTRGNWSPFGPPGHGPFGAPGNGPFGAPGNGPFGRSRRAPFGAAGFGPFDTRGRGNGGAAGPSRQEDYSVGKEWAEVGKEIGKIGEEFGKMMGDLGVQFGQRASRLGMNFERMASGSSSRQASVPTSNTHGQAHDDLPPSYEPPSGQESGVIHGDHKSQPDYNSSKTKKEKNKETHLDNDDDDEDDASSLSSDSSDSDSDSDSDAEDYRDAEKDCDKRLRSIEESATKSAAKGTKTPEEISRERASAVEKVQRDKQELASKFAIKQSKRAAMREVKKRSRQLKKEHRQRKRELRASSSSGKGKGKAKKSKGWKEEKKAYKDMKKVLRKEKLAVRKEWRDARSEWREIRNDIRRNRGETTGTKTVERPDQEELVWLVVENLGP